MGAGGETILCKWCGLPTAANRGVCEACGSPLTERNAVPRGSNEGRARLPAPPAAAPAPQAAASRHATVAADSPVATAAAAQPSRAVHAARLVSLIVSLAPGGGGGETMIRFFTPEGQLVAQVASGSVTYEEALRLVLS